MYVIDTDALLAIPAQVSADGLNLLLEELVSLVEDGLLHFPDLVISECRRLAHGEDISLWVRTVSGSRRCKSVAYRFSMEVMAQCPSLLDEDSEDESAPVAVAALACCLREGIDGDDVYVVTEDRRPLPTRMSLASACGVLEIPEISLREFLKKHSLDSYLSD